MKAGAEAASRAAVPESSCRIYGQNRRCSFAEQSLAAR
jgi:hypothetical protein